MCDIDYCRFYSIYAATLYVDCGPFYCMPPAHLPCVCLQSFNQQNERPRKVPLACVVWIRLAAAEISARTIWNLLAAAKVRRECVFWKLLRTLLEVELFACVVIVLRHFVELFRQSTAERERCCSTSDISGRVVSTWTLLLIVRHLLEACYIVVDAGVQRGPSARRSPGVSWSVNGSGSSDRVVPFHLISIAERGHAVRTVHRVFLSSLVVEVRVCRTTPEDR